MIHSEVLLFISLISVGIAVSFFLFTFLGNKPNKKVLEWLSSEDKMSQIESPILRFLIPFVHQFTFYHAQKIKSPSYRKRIENSLMTSGQDKYITVDEFIGLQILCGIFLPFALMALNFALQGGYSYSLFLGLIAIGLFLPFLYINTERKKRVLSVRVDLPFVIDLLALSTEAGLDFIGSIQRLVRKMEGSVLSQEFNSVLKDIKLGSPRGKALRSMGRRLAIPEVTSFVAVIIDADATGASIAQVLKDQSDQMRVERFTRAEKAGAKASQAILLPLMMFILPAVFIMVFGPIILQFTYGQ